MRFHGSGSFEEGVSDVDPVAAPATILTNHLLAPRYSPKNVLDSGLSPANLYLLLDGATAETLTLTLYFLVEDKDYNTPATEYKNTSAIWVPFATGEVITVGTLTKVSTGIPAGGIVYARRTADTIAGGETRKLLFAWY